MQRPTSQFSSAQIESLLERAIAFHKDRSFVKAKVLYEDILEVQPEHSDALHLLGLIAFQTSAPRRAVELIDKAIHINGRKAEYHSSRGIALAALGESEEAIASYDAALALRPDFAEAHSNRGLALSECGHYQDAIAAFDKATTMKPNSAIAYNNRGYAHALLKNADEALADFSKAISIDPHYAEAHYNRGNILRELGQLEAAIDSFDRAIEIKPDYADAYYNRGNTFGELSRYIESILSYDKAIAFKSDYAAAHCNRGKALNALQRFADAVVSFDKAIALRPDYAEAFRGQGDALSGRVRFEKAVASYDKAIALNPGHAGSYYSRGSAFQFLGRFDESAADYQKVFEIDPNYPFISGAILYAKMATCNWEGVDDQFVALRTQVERGEQAALSMEVMAFFDSPSLHRVATEIRLHALYPEDRSLGDIPPRVKGGKIRIGYYSADFHNHPVSHIAVEYFESHDRDKFEMYAFSYGPDTNDEIRGRVAAAFDEFIDVRYESDRDIARISRDLKIDIAIDLSGLTLEGRTGVFAFRAAPIQISYLGYLGTMAADYYDYLIADKTVVPPQTQKHYAEKIAYLPIYHARAPHRPAVKMALSREDIGLPAAGFVFCCFNSAHKITPLVFDSWMRILKAVNDSVLLLYAHSAVAMENLRLEAVKRGVASDRLVRAEFLPLPEHLARFSVADLFLDTLPYNAGTTASDALSVGLPVLTCAGESFASRMASSVLRAVGLSELITQSLTDYESQAIELATNTSKLRRIKEKLHRNHSTWPLFDPKLLTRHLEAAYAAMYERHHAGLSPEHFEVSSGMGLI